MVSCDPIWGFWGKLDRNDPSRANPLLAHLADVAAVMEALLSLPIYKRRFEFVMKKELDPFTLARFCVFAAIHDLGKTTAGFQLKNCEGAKTHGHILPMGALNNPGFLKQFLDLFPWIEDWGPASSDYLICSFGHHGKYPRVIDESFINSVYAKELAKLWNIPLPSGLFSFEGLKAISSSLNEWFPLAFQPDALPLPGLPLAQHLFVGVLTMADWIGSDERFFPFAELSDSPKELIAISRERARNALQVLKMDVGQIRKETKFSPNFEKQFDLEPLPIQKSMDYLKINPSGGIVILEAETGSGKTECALRYFARLFSEGVVDSLYFANPLRFAATQLQKRVSAHMEKLFGSGKMPTVLAVPGYLVVDDNKGLSLPGFNVLWPDEEKDPRENWASERTKRFLCAPCAVGTIDQALLSTLRVPHAHLRAAGISRSLLVIDEVHASDHFTIRLIESLVALFRDFGGQVLMMSATLGGAVRDRFISIFESKKELGFFKPRQVNEYIDAPYPLITFNGGALAPEHAGSKTVKIKTLPDLDSPEKIAKLALEAAGQGACVLVLRNSIATAVETQKELEIVCGKNSSILFTVNSKPTLHHSRFAPDDRRLLDNQVEKIFGKQGNERRPCVVVSTQTLEQSLDIDFDLLITDLCPADVLLQRIGRLFRHKRIRPDHFQSPFCYILLPEGDIDWLLSSAAKHHQFGEDRAYEDIGIIAATWEQLKEISQVEGTGTLRIPEINRYLVEKTTHPDIVQELARSLGSEWVAKTVSALGKRAAMKQHAAIETIDWLKPYSAESVSVNDDSRIVTRLGLDDIAISFDPPPMGPFSQEVDRLNIPGWIIRGGDTSNNETLTSIETYEGGFKFSFCGKTFRYDRYGLERG